MKGVPVQLSAQVGCRIGIGFVVLLVLVLLARLLARLLDTMVTATAVVLTMSARLRVIMIEGFEI